MTDHIDRAKRANPTRNVVGVRELKTHAARIIRHVRESRASYLVTHRGRTVGVILPIASGEDEAQEREDASGSAAWDAFLRAGRRLEQRFRPSVSGVRILSTMRR